MYDSSPRPADEVEAVVHRYGDMLFRLCYVMLGNEADAEDAVQETFISYLKNKPTFKEAEHEKAWLITTAKNKCRDALRQRRRRPQISLEDLREPSYEPPDSSDSGILEALMSLPEKFRLVLILHYVEEYRVEDIARIIEKTPSAVKMRLQKGRRLLEEKYRKEYL